MKLAPVATYTLVKSFYVQRCSNMILEEIVQIIRRPAMGSLILLVIFGITFGATACSSAELSARLTEVAISLSPMPVSAPEETEVPPSPTPIPPTAVSTPTEPPSPASSESCVACHTDQATLQQLAVVQEVKSEATSGEG